MLEGVGSEINLLKRKIQRLDTGLAKGLSSADGSFYRVCVGVCLYLSRGKPDIVFPVIFFVCPSPLPFGGSTVLETYSSTTSRSRPRTRGESIRG